jgi:hypothetical protein
MIEELSRAANRAEQRERFAADADQTEATLAMGSGKAAPLGEAFDYLDGRLDRRKPRRPRAPRRGSK